MKHLPIFMTIFCFSSLQSEVHKNFNVEKNETYIQEPYVIIKNAIPKKVYLEPQQIEKLDEGFLIRFDDDHSWVVPQIYYDEGGVYCEIL